MAVLSFALQDSDLPLQTAYPILMANLVRYLLPASDPLASSSAAGLPSSVSGLPPGFYTLERPDLPALEYAVNLFSMLESDLAIRPEIQLGGQSIPPAASAETGQRELWPWLAGLGWLALLAEWALYQSRRRMISGWRDLRPAWRAVSRGSVLPRRWFCSCWLSPWAGLPCWAGPSAAMAGGARRSPCSCACC
jgi:hypothetical protein